ncbi:MAG: CoA-binding protein [Hydrococcus sp. Prado102]|jgi:acyl-CoA synthetase (NDP forming)|nr:CoA-binding protein [Hydrococcus sp. Prado102]
MKTPIATFTDPAYDILRSEYQPLRSLFAPKTVAVIGATDRPSSVGRTLLWNLVSNPFGGTVFPVNPKYHSVMGIVTYPKITAISESIDLAIIATPAPTVPEIIKECVAAGVRSAIIVSAGFKEIGAQGSELERQIVTEARKGRLRIIGPNCLGVMNPHTALNATFAGAMARPGNVGKTDAGGKASTSHTGALTGSDEVLNAAFRRSGVLRVTSISELFDMAEVLAKQPRPKGSRLTLITNAGGPAVLATDMLAATGGQLSELSPEAIASLDRILPPYWSHSNPIDILGDAEPDRYQKTVEIAASDPNSDGLLVILTPQAMTNPTQTAEQLKSFMEKERVGLCRDKPIIASWMGGAEILAGEAILNRAKIPTYPYPDSAARAFNYMWQYTYNLRGIYETPALPEEKDGLPERALVRDLIAKCSDPQY